MTIYDDMRGYVHTHDRNGWFDVATETTPMYQMVDKGDAENAKLRELVRIMHGELVSCEDNGYVCGGHKFDDRVRELGIEVR